MATIGQLALQQCMKSWVIADAVEVGIGWGELAIFFGGQLDGGG